MLELLDAGPASATALAGPFDVSLTAITQHIRILEAAHLITTVKRGRQRICSLDRDALSAAEDWIVQRRLSWDRRLDRLETHLDTSSSRKGHTQ